MSIFLVNRHTRAEEESERAELVRSNVVGRHAPAAAAVIGGANIVVGLVCAAGFIAFDYQRHGASEQLVDEFLRPCSHPWS
jgi:ABC-2 type transport system permease protein